MHYGVKGQEWGVRRYQNKDGSLTPEGRKRAKQDADKLSDAMKKHLDSTNDFQRSLKITHLVDKNGFNRWTSDGKGYFDPSGGVITTTDTRKLEKKRQNEQNYLNIKKFMEQSYDSVKVEAKYYIETGKAASKIILEKSGEQFVSEFTKNYGSFDTSKQIEFKRMFKD